VRFFITFGQRYAREAHPRLAAAHPDGWVLIEARTYDSAREIAFANLGVFWGEMYDTEDFRPEYFPRGEIARFAESVPT